VVFCVLYRLYASGLRVYGDKLEAALSGAVLIILGLVVTLGGALGWVWVTLEEGGDLFARLIPVEFTCVLCLLCNAAVGLLLPRLNMPGVLYYTALSSMFCAIPYVSFALWTNLGLPLALVLVMGMGAVVGQTLGILNTYTDENGAMESPEFSRVPPPCNMSTQGRSSAFPGRKTNGRAQAAYTPKVSFHVPTYAEPPDMVVRTLEALAEMDYPNYEVIVLDNNTPDRSLWEPVQKWCEVWNARNEREVFRFFHDAPITGAKAGALNLGLRRTADDARLIAVIDADYVAEPSFLRDLVPRFANESVAYVQTSHDYREVDTTFAYACYAAYMPFYKVINPCWGDLQGGIVVGTMALFRRDLLERVGGWAEWSLTEDSEISYRLHTHGYPGHVITQTYGRGLIPETFTDYRKQRFRWAAGPLQTFFVHWRRLVPVCLGGTGSMTSWQRFVEFRHSMAGVNAVPVLFSWLVVVLVLHLFEYLQFGPNVVPVVYFAGVAYMLSNILDRAFFIRLSGLSPTPWTLFLCSLAENSLRITIAIAVLAGSLSREPLKWNRTPKFKPYRNSQLRLLKICRYELFVALLYAGAIAYIFLYDFPARLKSPVIPYLTVAVLATEVLSALSALAMSEIANAALAPKTDASPGEETSEATDDDFLVEVGVRHSGATISESGAETDGEATGTPKMAPLPLEDTEDVMLVHALSRECALDSPTSNTLDDPENDV